MNQKYREQKQKQHNTNTNTYREKGGKDTKPDEKRASPA
jgi:hypothetical protein